VEPFWLADDWTLHIVHSTLMVSLVWSRLMTEVGAESLAVSEDDAEVYAKREVT